MAAQSLKDLTEQEKKDLVDRCAIWQESKEKIADLERSLPSYGAIIGKLLKAGAKPEKITYDTVCRTYIDCVGNQESPQGVEECIIRYNLK